MRPIALTAEQQAVLRHRCEHSDRLRTMLQGHLSGRLLSPRWELVRQLRHEIDAEDALAYDLWWNGRTVDADESRGRCEVLAQLCNTMKYLLAGREQAS